jgi:hypothetical protein
LQLPHPKNGLELAFSYDRTGPSMSDQISFNPITFIMINRKGKTERIEKANLYWRMYSGRYKLPPIPNTPGKEDIIEKGSLIMLYPYDLKGFSAVRTRFWDVTKPDDFISYIPALRRVRRLAGTDTQDPIIGTDIPWEDWRGWWQNLSQKVWPAEYKIKGEGIFLTPVRRLRRPAKLEKGLVYTDWEKRPLWVLEIDYNTPQYIYSRRVIYFDKETFQLVMIEDYDQRGNLWKTWHCNLKFYPDTGDNCWWNGDVIDHVNRHRTFWTMEAIPNDPNVTEDFFDLKFLVKMAH